MKKIAISIALFGLLGISATSYAALEDRGNGLIYDTDLNLTWLADANYSKSSGYHTTGSMNWGAANTWAADLNFQGHNDWRLPTTDEMNHLFYGELGGTAGRNISTDHNLYYDLFSNVQDNYWSSSEEPNNSNNALGYRFNYGTYSGDSFADNKTIGHYAMAVSAVPESETYALFLAGLGLLGWRMRNAQR